MREYSPLNSLTGVSAGGTASLGLPIGNTYEKIHFDVKGATPEQITNIRVELAGRMLTEYSTLADLIKENDFYKREKADGLTTLFFTRPEVKSALKPTLVEQRFFGLGTTGLSLAQIKFDISPDAANPSVKAYAEKAAPSLPGWLFKRRTFRYSMTAGINEISDLPKPSGSYIAMIEIKKAGVTEAEFVINNVKWRDRMPKALHNLILQQAGRAPQADIHAIDLMSDGDVFGALYLDKAINDMRLRIECESAGQAEIVVHYFDDYMSSSF